MADVPPTVRPPMVAAPHRGVLILVLGILGIILCVICGIVAWVMANADLREMDAGRMDPMGRGMTQAGKICGIVGVALASLGILGALLFLALGLGVAATAGTGA